MTSTKVVNPKDYAASFEKNQKGGYFGQRELQCCCDGWREQLTVLLANIVDVAYTVETAVVLHTAAMIDPVRNYQRKTADAKLH